VPPELEAPAGATVAVLPLLPALVVPCDAYDAALRVIIAVYFVFT
jgi:hypothetical protein